MLCFHVLQMADIAIDAMVRGIFAGDCRKLSVQACFPPLYQMEQKHGSLFAGALFGSKGLFQWMLT